MWTIILYVPEPCMGQELVAWVDVWIRSHIYPLTPIIFPSAYWFITRYSASLPGFTHCFILHWCMFLWPHLYHPLSNLLYCPYKDCQSIWNWHNNPHHPLILTSGTTRKHCQSHALVWLCFEVHFHKTVNCLLKLLWEIPLGHQCSTLISQKAPRVAECTFHVSQVVPTFLTY